MLYVCNTDCCNQMFLRVFVKLVDNQYSVYISNWNELVTGLGTPISVVLLPRNCRGPLKPITRRNVLCPSTFKDSLLNTAARDQVVKKCFNQATCVHCVKLYEKSRDEIIPLAMLYIDAEKNGILHKQNVIVCC